MGPRIALVAAAVLAAVASVVWSAENTGPATEQTGHTVSLILFVIAGMIGLLAVVRLVWPDEDDEDE